MWAYIIEGTAFWRYKVTKLQCNLHSQESRSFNIYKEYISAEPQMLTP